MSRTVQYVLYVCLLRNILVCLYWPLTFSILYVCWPTMLVCMSRPLYVWVWRNSALVKTYLWVLAESVCLSFLTYTTYDCGLTVPVCLSRPTCKRRRTLVCVCVCVCMSSTRSLRETPVGEEPGSGVEVSPPQWILQYGGDSCETRPSLQLCSSAPVPRLVEIRMLNKFARRWFALTQWPWSPAGSEQGL